MSDIAFVLAFLIGFPILFSIGVFTLGLKLARKFDFRKSIFLIAITFAIAFYIFRLFYVLLWSIVSIYSEFSLHEGSFVSNLVSEYEFLFSWVDTGESLYYVLYRRSGIYLPDVLYQNWLGVSVMEVLFYLFIGVIISVAAKLWKGKLLGKIGAVLLLLATMAFYLNVIVHWMYLAMHL
jgi:hypothetical protein